MTAPSRAAPLRIVELPYRFGTRQSGESKLGARVVLDFIGLLLAKATNDVLSARFIYFSLIGLTGIGVHFIALAAAIHFAGTPFIWAQTLATAVAIGSNFVLNNVITYRDQRLHGGPQRIGVGRGRFARGAADQQRDLALDLGGHDDVRAADLGRLVSHRLYPGRDFRAAQF